MTRLRDHAVLGSTREVESQIDLAELLPWRVVLPDLAVIRNHDGSLQATYRLAGPDLIHQPRSVKGAASKRSNNALRRLDGQWMLHSRMRRVPVTDYARGVFPDETSQAIEDEHYAAYHAPGHHFYTEYYLTLCYKPQRASVLTFERLWTVGHAPTVSTTDHDLVQTFRSSADHLASLIAADGDLVALTIEETLTYLHSLISTKSHRVGIPDDLFHVNYSLVDTMMRPGYDVQLGPHHLRMVSIVDLPERSVAGLLQGLTHLPFRCEWSSRYLAVSKARARSLMKHIQGQHYAGRKTMLQRFFEGLGSSDGGQEDTDKLNKSLEVDLARQALGADRVAYGYATDVVVVGDTDPKKADEKARTVEELINDTECVASIEEMNALDAWRGGLDGEWTRNFRKPMISSLNKVHLFFPGLMATWTGIHHNTDLNCPPLTYGTTEESTPFALDTYVDEVPHVAIVGPTRAGKSTSSLFLISQSLRRPDARVVICEMDSAEVITHAVGGRFYDVGHGGFAPHPLARVDDPHERTVVAEWLKDRLRESGLSMTSQIDAFLDVSLMALGRAPMRQRTLDELMVAMRAQSRYVQTHGTPQWRGGGDNLYADWSARNDKLTMHEAVRQALFPYTKAGSYGVLFDGEEGTGQGNWHCFRMAGLLEWPGAIRAYWSCLANAFRYWMDGRPTTLFLDEAAKYVDDERFVAQVKSWLRLLGKQNWGIWFATHSLDDLSSSPISQILLESCFTRLLLPNPRATEPELTEIYTDLGLTPEQVSLIAEATPKRDIFYDSPRGSRLFSLRLGPIAATLCGANKPPDARLCREIIQMYGPDKFAKNFLEAKGLGATWEAITRDVPAAV
jgi:type IV secretory pathway VirB4 component